MNTMGSILSKRCEPLPIEKVYAKVIKRRENSLMDEIEKLLQTVKHKGQYRDKTQKKRFNLEWAFLIGNNVNALGASSFETPHNFKAGKGVNTTPVEQQRLPKWKKELWTLAKKLITLIDPDFAAGEYVVNYACMNQPDQYVKKHTDSEDISYQYALNLGDYKGAYTRCFDENENVLGEFDYHRRICKMDGRLPHEVIQTDFEGVRYTLVWFKVYDHRKTKPDPLFPHPCFV